MKRDLVTVLLALLLPALWACGDDGEELPDDVPVAEDPSELEYAPELGVDFGELERSETGLYLHDLEVGEGPEAEEGQILMVHYTGSLPDGSVFDSSREREQPFPFPLGAGIVIPGWDEGLVGMRPGGRRLLVIPPHLGYGPEGSDDVIPPNATLVFDVELLDIH